MNMKRETIANTMAGVILPRTGMMASQSASTRPGGRGGSIWVTTFVRPPIAGSGRILGAHPQLMPVMRYNHPKLLAFLANKDAV
jgi:hypothetical protein